MRLKDTLSQSLKELNPNQVVKIYSCGPTIYDYPHLGNWYTFLRWELLVRSLQALNFKTQWVMNITDVGHLVSDADSGEDKLQLKALKERKTAWQIAAYYGDYFMRGLKRLNFVMPDALPKATEYIAQQIDLVVRLENQGLTYVLDDGVYYDTSKLEDYGKLAQKDRSGFQAGARVSHNSKKRNATDFALWKLTPKNKIRDMEWDSPWGRGFPGWHLECSAMCQELLGTPISIHAGGVDHIPIHHTNELAQSEPIYGRPMADIWLHGNFITIDGQKMSKSLNNFYTLEDIEKKGFNLQALRLAVFSTRYFNAADFNWNLMQSASQRLCRWQNLAVRRFQLINTPGDDPADLVQKAIIKTKAHLADNLNSPAALAEIDSLCQQLANKQMTFVWQESLNLFIQAVDTLFGVQLATTKDLSQQQKELLQKRQKARVNKDFQSSDLLRDKLEMQGIEVIDHPQGYQIWQLKRIQTSN